MGNEKWFILVSILCLSCGALQSKHDRILTDQNKDATRAIAGGPLLLGRTSPECAEGTALQNDAVSETFWGDTLTTEHRPGFSTATRILAPSTLELCPNYNLSGIEGVALVSLDTLHNAAQFYQSLTGKLLDPINLNLQPLSEWQIGAEHGYEMDNIWWGFSPRAEDSYEITILPQENAKASMTPLWQKPIYLYQAYGHYVFRQLIATIFEDEASGLAGYLRENPITTVKGGITGRAPSPLINPQLFLALNQGFADLYAAYGVGTHFDLPSCAEDRLISADHFASGVPKAFNNPIISAMFFSEPLTAQSANHCPVPVMQDAHDLGAIFAHGLDQFFAVTTLEPRNRAQLLLKMMTTLNQAYRPGEYGPYRFLREILRVAIETAAHREKGVLVITLAQCQMLEAKFPFIITAWQDEWSKEYPELNRACNEAG